jgi:plasmid maintenance system killer protein
MDKELMKELQEQGSILSKIPKRVIDINASVPEGYFENMESQFFAKLKDNQPKTTSVSIWETYRVRYRIAAVGIFAIVGFGLFTLLRNNSEMTLSQNELKSYFAKEGEIDELNLCHDCGKTHKKILDNITDDEIKAYLLETEGVDINKI